MQTFAKVLCCLVAFTVPVDLAAIVQETSRVVVGPNIRVGGDLTAPYVEPMVAVNPVDPDNLVGVSMKFDSAGLMVVALASRDGGRAWLESPIPACRFDPWVAFLPTGMVLLSCQQGETVQVFRSGDGGATWSEPTQVSGDSMEYDHPTLAVDPTDGARRGTAYVVSGHSAQSSSGSYSHLAPAVATSLDGGRTFSAQVRLQSTNVWSMPSSPVVLSDGTLGFTINDFAVDAGSAGGFIVLKTGRMWWATSTDGGRTLSMPHLIAEVEEMSRWGGVAVDRSDGPFRDRLYATVDDFREGSGGVFVYHSADRGETWSAAIRVNRPDTVGQVRRLPAVAVNPRGEVLVAWFDPLGEPGRTCWRLMASASVDGGESFLSPVSVAEVAFCNDQPGNVVAPGVVFRTPDTFDVGERWPAGGDYFGLAAHPDGSFRILWADSRSGVFQLWTASIYVQGQG